MAEITIKCVEGNPLAINVVMTAIEHSMLNGEMVTETVDFYPDTTKPVRAVLDCTTARRQYCPQTSVSDNVVYVSDNGSIAAGVYTLTITCTDTQGKKRRYKSDPCIEVYDATSAAEIAATFDSQTYELNGVFYTFAGGGGTVQADWDETDPNAPSYIQNKPDLSEYATDEELQAVEESIPDVPAWALQPQKPTYTAGEVGAVPTTRTVNGKALSQDITLNANDVGAQPTIQDLSEIRSGAAKGATAYQKPSGGIPKSDLATAVQTSLNKADSALQSYTESDPVFTASPAHGITSADITAWNGKASKVAIVNHGTSDTTFTLTPNIFHVWGTVASLTLTLATASTTTMDEFMFQFTSGTAATTLSLPSTVKWVAEPEIEAGMTYQVSIVNNIAVIGGVS